MVACSQSREEYLRSAINTATRDDIVQRFGPADETQVFPNGDFAWVYRVKKSGDPPDDCEAYRLTFDAGKRLRRWESEHC
jgi:hypothetical protein